MRSSEIAKHIRWALISSACSITTFAGTAQAQSAPPEQGPTVFEEEIVVTGYRKSLEDSAAAKRAATNFTDSVFAEDIGKFPDLNIAESLNRIPGIQLTREITGEGLNVAIRGLNSNFTKITLNSAQVAVASSGRTDSQNQNREVDLDLFPTELFTSLDVSKTSKASMIEGGVSGTVNMRAVRPFDHPGTQISYQLQGDYGQSGSNYSPRGALTASWTSSTFGALVGIAGVRNKVETQGFETIGWTNPTITNGMCGTSGAANGVSAACNTTGGNGWSQPGINATTGLGTVPAGVGNGLTPGATIDRAFLESKNPGLSLEQLGNAIIPRLARPSYSAGTRDRISGLVSLEYRPTLNLRFYLDSMYADANRKFDRLDMDLVGRNGGIIPVNWQVDANQVVTKGTFENAQFFLEARPYDEQLDFYNFNPGVHYDLNEWLGMDFQLNKSHSKFDREAPSILVNTPLGQGLAVQYDNTGGETPTLASNVDLNNPGIGWTWAGGRVNIQNEKRVTDTEGAHLDLRVGNDDLSVKIGGAYDKTGRTITALDNSRAWQQTVCGGGGAFIPAPAAAPACNGQAGSAIPQANLASYLMPGPAGFISLDFNRFFADTNYRALSDAAPVASGAATGASSGGVEEKTYGAYVELNGGHALWSRMLRFNAGARYVTTDQAISSPYIIGGITQQGPWQVLLSDYNKVLPSFNLAYDVTEDVVARASASRTLTRANPSAMLPSTTFTDISAQNANQGNPNLSPYLSDNIDLGGEWYTGEEGFLGLTLFQKKITGFTVLGTRTLPFLSLGIPYSALVASQQAGIDSRGGPNVATVVVSQQVNSDGVLQIRGMEATWVQKLNFITDGLGVNLNFTKNTQKGSGTGAPAQAIGISPYTYNATAYYENRSASVRLSYVWNDEQTVTGPNQNGIPLAQLHADAYGQLDLSASFEFETLPTSPQITLNLINITGESQRATFQYDNAAFTYYDPGFQVLLGVRGTF
jgi:TonB-dependent receptor